MIFKGWINPAELLEDLNGFAEIVHPAETTDYNSGVFGVLPCHFVRQTDGRGTLVWRTKALKKENVRADGNATFRWPASTGFVTEPAGGQFTLFVDGKEILTFDLAMKSKTWQTADKRISLAYEVMGFTRSDKQDSVGIMTLTVPAGVMKTGESVEISVKGSASGSKRFFMLYRTP